MSNQANQGRPLLVGCSLAGFLVFVLVKASARGLSPPPSSLHLQQLHGLIIGKAGISDEPRKQAFGHVALVATNKERDRWIILAAHDNMAIRLMVYILASLQKDFNNLARFSNRQFHVAVLPKPIPSHFVVAGNGLSGRGRLWN